MQTCDDLQLRRPIRILFTHFGEQWFRGSEALLLDLMRGLDPVAFQPVVWCNGDHMAEACRDSGFPTTQSDFSYYFDYGSPRFSLSKYAALLRQGSSLIIEHRIDVLHANSAAPTQWLLPLARRSRLPLLTHLHTTYLRRSRFASLLHQSDLVVGVSSHAIEGLLTDGMPLDRTKVIYNGIAFRRLDVSSADLRSKLGIEPWTKVIGTVGSLIPRKGHDTLLAAVARITDPMTHLLVAGDGPDRSSLEALAVSLGLEQRVHFLGNYQPIADVYRACDIFALASRGDAFGLVLAEAGHLGLPTVSTRVGGISEVVADGQTGLLTPPDDVPAFADALARLIADPTLRARLGAAAIERVHERFSVEQMARQFEQTYAALAALPAAQFGWRALLHGLRPYARLIWSWLTKGKPRYAG